jgi:nucleoid DNA-binding protein
MASNGNASIGNEKNVTKKCLVDEITKRSNLSRHDVQTVVQGVLDQMVEAIGQGKRIEIRDFGVFEVKSRAARTAQNPKTLEPVPVPPKLAVRFKPGRLMKAALEQGSDGLASPGDRTPMDSRLDGHASREREAPLVEVARRQPVHAGAGRD